MPARPSPPAVQSFYAGRKPPHVPDRPPPDNPLVITAGGTYTGTVRSSDSTVPAITLSTKAPVTLDRMTIYHAGRGVHATTTGNLKVTNCTFTALQPTVNDMWFAINLGDMSALTVWHNQFTGCGAGVYLDQGGGSLPYFDVSYNNFTNISYYNYSWLPASGFSTPGAVHINHCTFPNGANTTWNRVTNHYTQSVCEDCFSATDSHGAAGFPLYWGHNLVNGCYPSAVQTCPGGSGTATNTGDLGGSYQTCQYLTGVHLNNGGVQIVAGQNMSLDSCTIISSGLTDTGVTCTRPDGGGIGCYDGYSGTYGTMTNCTVSNCTSGYLRWTGSAFQRADYNLIGAVGTYTNNTSLSHDPTEADITSAISAYEASVVSAGVTIGPL